MKVMPNLLCNIKKNKRFFNLNVQLVDEKEQYDDVTDERQQGVCNKVRPSKTQNTTHFLIEL
jgi:hypothetical protein